MFEKTAILEREQKLHLDLKTRYEAVVDENERQLAELLHLQSEVRSFSELLASREGRINALERETLAAGGRLAALSGELADERFKSNLATERLAAAEEEIGQRDALTATLSADLDAMADARAMTERQARTLESRLSEERLEQNIAAELWRQDKDRLSDEILRLKAECDLENARSETAEASLAQTRAETHAAKRELAESANAVEQARAKLDPLDRALAAANEEIAALSKKIVDLEKSRALLADRGQALVRAMTDQRAQVELANERAARLEDRLGAEKSRFSTEIDQLEEHNRQLETELDKERSAHLIAEHALNVARSQIARRRATLPPGSAEDFTTPSPCRPDPRAGKAGMANPALRKS